VGFVVVIVAWGTCFLGAFGKLRKSTVGFVIFFPIQFISLSIDPLQGVNQMDVEDSHRIHQNVQSSTIQLDTVCVS
jgi:hypothetical protein